MENERILIIQFQLTRFKVLAILTALFICFHPKLLGSEQLTLTTYYPSPYGGYAKLLTTDQTLLARDAGRVGVGNASPARTLHVGGTDSTRGQISLTQNGSVATNSTAGIYWHSGTGYGIYREAGAWSNPYPDLRIAFNTGIKFGANSNYNGMRFYNSYTMPSTGLVMAVNDASTSGANNVYVKNRLGINRTPSYPLDVTGDARISGRLLGMCKSVTYVEGGNESCGSNYQVFAHYGRGDTQISGFLPASGNMGGVGTFISLGQDWNGTLLCCRIQ